MLSTRMIARRRRRHRRHLSCIIIDGVTPRLFPSLRRFAAGD
jgi:hypothetical protein